MRDGAGSPISSRVPSWGGQAKKEPGRSSEREKRREREVALTFLRSRPKASRPETAVTYFLLFRSMRRMVMTLWASLSACFCSAASALAAFFCASLAARFWASTESDAVAASRASELCGLAPGGQVVREGANSRCGKDV